MMIHFCNIAIQELSILREVTSKCAQDYSLASLIRPYWIRPDLTVFNLEEDKSQTFSSFHRISFLFSWICMDICKVFVITAFYSSGYVKPDTLMLLTCLNSSLLAMWSLKACAEKRMCIWLKYVAVVCFKIIHYDVWESF
jgi:hypothetical protein